MLTAVQLFYFQNETPVSLASCLASVDAHRVFVKVDREEVASLEAKIREAKKAAPADVSFAFMETGLNVCTFKI